jgi:hypothetical protein
VERVLEEVRRWVEGRRYESMEAKKTAIEEVLRWLEAEEKVSSLVGWPYIRQTCECPAFMIWYKGRNPHFAAIPLPLSPCGKRS